MPKVFDGEGQGPYPRTHDAFQRFIVVARGRPDVRHACGLTRGDQFHAYIDSLLELAGHIQNLTPEGADHPKPEYPWAGDKGQVISPLQYDYPLTPLASARMIRMLRFLESCFRTIGDD